MLKRTKTGIFKIYPDGLLKRNIYIIVRRRAYDLICEYQNRKFMPRRLFSVSDEIKKLFFIMSYYRNKTINSDVECSQLEYFNGIYYGSEQWL